MVEQDNFLKKVRISLRKSKAALAREAGIDVKTYNAVEGRKRRGNEITRAAIKEVVNKYRNERRQPPLTDEELFN